MTSSVHNRPMETALLEGLCVCEMVEWIRLSGWGGGCEGGGGGEGRGDNGCSW
jgi:hypothetical protein